MTTSLHVDPQDFRGSGSAVSRLRVVLACLGRGRQAAARKTAASSSARIRTASVAVLLAAIASVAAGCFLIPNVLPVADVEVDRTAGLAPLTIHFDGTGSFDPDGSIRRYEWDFGDGSRSVGAEIAHTYTRGGTFTATLTVTDRRGGTASASVEIVVRASNALPVAAFSVYPSPAYTGQGIQFGAGASYDPDGEIVSYAWNYGDGTSGSGRLTTHQYSLQGTYHVVLTVRDNDGGERTATAELRITTTIDTSGTIPRHFEWDYNGNTQSCDLAISRDLLTQPPETGPETELGSGSMEGGTRWQEGTTGRRRSSPSCERRRSCWPKG